MANKYGKKTKLVQYFYGILKGIELRRNNKPMGVQVFKNASSDDSVPWCTTVPFENKRVLSLVERILKLD
ncbi:hypothetical protein V6N13_108634 [Hibiscus sabdariffa]